MNATPAKSLLDTICFDPIQDLRLERLFPRCENLSCGTNRGILLRILRRPSGIRLHGRWYCGPDCFEQAVAEDLCRLPRFLRRPRPKQHRIPLGLLLLSRGVIDEEQLKVALRMQHQGIRPRLGDCLRERGWIREQQITTALSVQWGCPVFPLEQDLGYLECAALLPMPLLESGRMLPVYRSRDGSLMYIGFTDGIDHATLSAIEHMLECRTAPCVVAESTLFQCLDEIRKLPRPEQIAFDTTFDPPQMARTIRGYAIKLHAYEVRVGCSGENAWVRFLCTDRPRDLLFHLLLLAPL